MSHQTQMGFFQEIPGIHQECAQMGRHKRFKKDMKQKNRKGIVTTTATLEAVRRVWFLPLRGEGLFAVWAAASLLLLHFGGGWQGLWKRLPCAIQGCGERCMAEGSRCLCPAQGRRLRSRRAIAASRPPGNRDANHPQHRAPSHRQPPIIKKKTLGSWMPLRSQRLVQLLEKCSVLSPQVSKRGAVFAAGGAAECGDRSPPWQSAQLPFPVPRAHHWHRHNSHTAPLLLHVGV